MAVPGIPFYIHPAADPAAWKAVGKRFAKAAGPRDGFLVLNVANGPGLPDDPYYPEAIAGLRSAAPGLHLVGYVDAAYGLRPDPAIIADVRAWADRYAITAVMLDQLPSGRAGATGTVRRSREVIALARSSGATWVAGNPGTQVHRSVFRALDVVCVHEQPGHLLPVGTRFKARRTWVLIHGVQPEHRTAIESACARAAYAWATTATLPHPWDGSGWCAGAQPGAR